MLGGGAAIRKDAGLTFPVSNTPNLSARLTSILTRARLVRARTVQGEEGGCCVVYLLWQCSSSSSHKTRG